jgi:hypothetical protein
MAGGDVESRGVREEQRECEAEGEVARLSSSSWAVRPCTQWANVLFGRHHDSGRLQFRIPDVVAGIPFLVSDKVLMKC